MTSGNKIALLPLAYLPPVGYFSLMEKYPTGVKIEQWDSYHKQTYRNRCRISGANGILDLVIPVVKNSGQKTLVKDVRIDYSTRWQANHWKSIISAYNSSPFFEYYADDFISFYDKKWDYLIDFNIEILVLLCELLNIKKNFTLTEGFEKEVAGADDYREIISPKTNINSNILPVKSRNYHQTFIEKFGFIENLSIIDLLFNEGRMSGEIIKIS
ncbi:MAG: WbqC family protein [Prolixibacteraceae bacterium]|nr:WbqC family protein [Prolixibacteraceae bacterium]